MPRCIIFANGILPDPDSARRLIRPDDLILAADGGTRHALDLGLTPSIIIGDLDSLTSDPSTSLSASLQPLTESGTKIIQHPRDKDATDLELALEYAIQNGQREIVIVAALGNRLDQTLGNLSLLTDPRLVTFDLRLDDGVEETFFCRDQAQVEGRRGDLVSLIPWGGEVRGVCTEGLRWPLSNEVLYPHKTRGISNEMTGEAANIKIESGLLLIVHRRLITENWRLHETNPSSHRLLPSAFCVRASNIRHATLCHRSEHRHPARGRNRPTACRGRAHPTDRDDARLVFHQRISASRF